MNRTLRIVATRCRDFDPAFLAFDRMHRHCCENCVDVVVDLPGWSGGQASIRLRRPGQAEDETLAVATLPAGGEKGEAVQLEGSIAFTDFLLGWVESVGIGFVHAFSWNLWDLVNQLGVVRSLPGLISVRGLDVMRGAAFGQVMYADTQAENVSVHCPSLELKRKLELLEVGCRVHFVPNGLATAGPPAGVPRDPIVKAELSKYDSVILIPGNVGEERGLTSCLRKVAEGVKDRTVVVLAGSRGFLLSDEEVIALCRDEGFAFDVRVVGPLAHPEIRSWYGLATLAVVPGGREGGQTSILECIAGGLPVLVESNETNRTLFGQGAPFVYGAHGIDLPQLLARLQAEEAFGRSIRAQQRAVLEGTLTADAEFRGFGTLYGAKQIQRQEANS